MSTLAFIPQAELTADDLTDDRLLEILSTNPEALLDLVYGPSRRIKNSSPPHDHDEDGGEPHKIQILSHSFGRYEQALVSFRGIPLGPPDTGVSFVSTTTDGILDRSAGKRMFCCGVVIPGGVSSVRVSLTEYHESSGLSTQLTATLRSLGSVNLKLGVAPEEVYCDIAYTTSGTAVNRNQSAEITDLTPLGDPTLDRELEFALWLTSDVSATEEQHILDVEVIGLDYTAAARSPSPGDLIFPPVAVKEIKAGSCVLSTQTSVKLKERYNGLNRGLWGSTPGLLNSLQPDRRRTYREVISDIHQHQGSMCPDGSGGIFGDGACLRDTQSFGYLMYVGEILPLVVGTPPVMTRSPGRGGFLHFTADLSTYWQRYAFRRSIPAGAGALQIRVACHSGYTYASGAYDTTQGLWMSCEITPVAGGSDIVTRMYCGENASPLDSGEVDYGYIKVEPEDDLAFLPNGNMRAAGKELWNRGVERSQAERTALNCISVTHRVSQIITIQLTNPVERSEETAHTTTDYNVKLRFKMRDGAALCDTLAGCLWIMCRTAPGY